MRLMLLAQCPACSEPSIKLGIVINTIITYGVKYIKEIMINSVKNRKGSTKRLQKDLAYSGNLGSSCEKRTWNLRPERSPILK